MLLHKGDKPFECPVCKKTYISKGNLGSHMKKHMAKKPFTCHYCQKTFIYNCHFQYHLRSHTGETLFQCDRCEITFKSKFLLRGHLHKMHRQFVCDLCGKMFPDENSINFHKEAHRLGNLQLVTVSPKTHLQSNTDCMLLECQLCEKTFLNKRGLASHMKKHNGVTHHICDLCNKTFLHESNFLEHLQRHSIEKLLSPKHECQDQIQQEQVTNVCQISDKTSANNGMLKCHLKTHSEVETFKCHACDLEFTSNYKLQLHLRGRCEKLFLCLQCNVAFPNNDNLLNHMSTHTSGSMFQCDLCKTVCEDDQKLRLHTFQEHGDSNACSCQCCRKIFANEDLFDKHLETCKEFVEQKSLNGQSCENTTADIDDIKEEIVTHWDEEESENTDVDADDINEEILTHCVEKENHIRNVFNQVCIIYGENEDTKSNQVTTLPFTCQLCDISFDDNESLETHLCLHCSEGPFECSLCGADFSDEDKLKVHLRIHATKELFKCKLCEKTFYRSDCLSHHVQTHSLS